MPRVTLPELIQLNSPSLVRRKIQTLKFQVKNVRIFRSTDMTVKRSMSGTCELRSVEKTLKGIPLGNASDPVQSFSNFDVTLFI